MISSGVRCFRRFIGVNLGGGKGKTTAIARLELKSGEAEPMLVVKEARLRHGHRGSGEAQQDADEGQLFHDEALLAYLKRWVSEDTVVAINAPLTLPPCVRCQLACPGISACTVPVVAWMRKHEPKLTPRARNKMPVITPYTQRAVEILFTHAGLRPRETLGQGPITARAAYLRRALSPHLRLHENLLEVHPPATIIRLFGEKTEHQLRHASNEEVWELRKELLRNLATPLSFNYVWPEIVARNPHIFDALMCGITAFFWAKQDWKGPVDLIDSQAEPESKTRSTKPLVPAITDFDLLWLEDGWIWAPPAKRVLVHREDLARP